MGKVRKPKEPQGRIRFLTEDEKHRLLDACKESESPYLYTIVVLALATGARKMEVLTLTWRDVDLKRVLVTVHETKNGERRALPLTGHAFDPGTAAC
jgi:integrase